MRIVSYQSGKVWVKKSEREEKYPHKKDGRRDIDKVRIILTMFYSDDLI